MAKLIGLAQWRPKIITTTAPGRLTAPRFPLSNDLDQSWLVTALSAPPDSAYASTDGSWQPRASRGRVTLSLESGRVAAEADLLVLMDTHHRVQRQERDHKIPQLAALWEHFQQAFHFEEVANRGFGPSTWEDWLPTLRAFAAAMEAATWAWGKYTAEAIGTLALPVRLLPGRTLMIDRFDDRGASVGEPVPIVLYVLEREPLEVPGGATAAGPPASLPGSQLLQ